MNMKTRTSLLKESQQEQFHLKRAVPTIFQITVSVVVMKPIEFNVRPISELQEYFKCKLFETKSDIKRMEYFELFSIFMCANFVGEEIELISAVNTKVEDMNVLDCTFKFGSIQAFHEFEKNLNKR